MNSRQPHVSRLARLVLAGVAWLGLQTPGRAGTTLFFTTGQTTNLVAAGTTSDTIRSAGYLFTFTRDKLFTGGVGLTNPVGRYLRVNWPAGLEAQAVTTGPSPGGAKMTIRREDGQPFAISFFTGKLLANTAGAGGSFEVMPKLNGEDARPDPFAYDASGYGGQSFTYRTPELSGFDAYTISLYVDFALMQFTAVDASAPPPELSIVPLGGGTARVSWPAEAVGYTLESTAGLSVPNWVAAAEAVSNDGQAFFADIQLDGASRYFRLRK